QHRARGQGKGRVARQAQPADPRRKARRQPVKHSPFPQKLHGHHQRDDDGGHGEHRHARLFARLPDGRRRLIPPHRYTLHTKCMMKAKAAARPSRTARANQTDTPIWRVTAVSTGRLWATLKMTAMMVASLAPRSSGASAPMPV